MPDQIEGLRDSRIQQTLDAIDLALTNMARRSDAASNSFMQTVYQVDFFQRQLRTVTHSLEQFTGQISRITGQLHLSLKDLLDPIRQVRNNFRTGKDGFERSAMKFGPGLSGLVPASAYPPVFGHRYNPRSPSAMDYPTPDTHKLAAVFYGPGLSGTKQPNQGLPKFPLTGQERFPGISDELIEFAHGGLPPSARQAQTSRGRRGPQLAMYTPKEELVAKSAYSQDIEAASRSQGRYNTAVRGTTQTIHSGMEKMTGSIALAAAGIDAFIKVAGTAMELQMKAVEGAAMSASMASPETWKTFTQYFELFIAKIGVQFVPYIIVGIRWIDGLIKQWDALDPATKKVVTSIGLFVTGIRTLTVAITAAVEIFMGAARVIEGIQKGNIRTDNLRNMAMDFSSAALDKSNKWNKDRTPEGIKASEDAAAAGINDRINSDYKAWADKQKMSRDARNFEWNRPDRSFAQRIIGTSDFRGEGVPTNVMEGMILKLAQKGAFATPGEESQASVQGKPGSQGRGFWYKLLVPEMVKEAQNPQGFWPKFLKSLKPENMVAGGTGDTPFKLGNINTAQPMFSALQDIHNQIQLKVLGEDDLSREMREIQKQMLDALLKASDGIKSIDEKTPSPKVAKGSG